MIKLRRNCARSAQNRSGRRTLALETLENRMLLTALPPKVAAVELASTQWTSTFVNYLESQGWGNGGYAIPSGANQLKSLPWKNLDQVRITFDQDVQIKAANLSVSGVNVTAYAFSDFDYNSATFTATWTLDQMLAADRILLDLDADGVYPVHNADGQALDGAWINGSSTFPSGTGNPGDDFEFRVNILPGDGDETNCVTLFDATMARTKIGKNAGDAGYSIRYDIDGDGAIAQDYNMIYAHLGTQLPVGDPAGMTNDAPTVLPMGNLRVNTNAADTIFSLGDIFADCEDPASNLTFSITGNTNSALFTSLAIDDGKLTVAFAADIEGTAAITLRAMDSGGLFVETTFNVNVADTLVWVPENDRPEITSFEGTAGYAGVWTFEGTVTDANQEVAGMIIIFGGVLHDFHVTAIVKADGTFLISTEFPGIQEGPALAWTCDNKGMTSNQASFLVLPLS